MVGRDEDSEIRRGESPSDPAWRLLTPRRCRPTQSIPDPPCTVHDFLKSSIAPYYQASPSTSASACTRSKTSSRNKKPESDTQQASLPALYRSSTAAHPSPPPPARHTKNHSTQTSSSAPTGSSPSSAPSFPSPRPRKRVVQLVSRRSSGTRARIVTARWCR